LPSVLVAFAGPFLRDVAPTTWAPSIQKVQRSHLSMRTSRREARRSWRRLTQVLWMPTPATGQASSGGRRTPRKKFVRTRIRHQCSLPAKPPARQASAHRIQCRLDRLKTYTMSDLPRRVRCRSPVSRRQPSATR